MMRFHYEYSTNESVSKVSVDVEIFSHDLNLDEVLERFESFLAAAGYTLGGRLEVVREVG